MQFQVKEGIPRIRENITEQIWEFTKENDYLRAENWTEAVIKKLQASQLGRGDTGLTRTGNVTLQHVSGLRDQNPGRNEDGRLGRQRADGPNAMDVRWLSILFDYRHHDHW